MNRNGHQFVPISRDLAFRLEQDEESGVRCVGCNLRGPWDGSHVFDKPCSAEPLFPEAS